MLGVWTSRAHKPSWQENEDIFPLSVSVSLVIVWEDENIINNARFESEWVAVASATQTSHWHLHWMELNSIKQKKKKLCLDTDAGACSSCLDLTLFAPMQCFKYMRENDSATAASCNIKQYGNHETVLRFSHNTQMSLTFRRQVDSCKLHRKRSSKWRLH